MPMKTKKCVLFLFMYTIVSFWFKSSYGDTNQADTGALQNLYTSLNSPSQLTGWSANGGDPCGQSWKGVRCSSSAVTQITLSGLGLTGSSLGYQLSQLTSLTVLDLSNNHISGGLPYQLPPNLERLNIAGNSFSNGNLPYSISTMTNLAYLDLSFNTLTGNLPQSFSSLFSLSTLYLQNNQLSGDLNVLASLSLHDLNVENNQFTGWIPSTFSSIPNLKDGGNNFNTSPAPPPPPYTPPPHKAGGETPNSENTGSPSDSSKSSKGSSGTTLHGGAIAGIVIAGMLIVIVAVLVLAFYLRRYRKDVTDEEKVQSTLALGPVTSSLEKVPSQKKVEPMLESALPEVALKPPPLDRYKAPDERISGMKLTKKRAKSPIAAASYTVADLQLATNSFSQENLIGEGALGRVYRAETPDGKLLAVKKIDTSPSPSIQKDEDFVETVSNISRLRHANIVELVGYCTEHGQHLLVYEYFGKGTLHDFLHSADVTSARELTWNVRVKIALGTARALEYLHEVCLPAIVHKNFKSANILLDDELNPHLSDCGNAVFIPSPEHQVTTQMMGSFGYSAPEYAMSGIYTVKSDVYSFGVVMLELLTGRRPLDSTRLRAEQSLVRWAAPQLHDIDALSKMVDPTLKGLYPVKSLSRFADIIALCVQPEPEFRPPMSEVVQSLVRLMQRATFNKRRPGEEQSSSDSHYPSDYSI
eukprot:c18454_g1_i4 orf=536-2632(+)